MKHPAAKKFLSLIEKARNFEEVETRIAALSEEKDRGDALEVFAEAYLRTLWATRFEEVWPAAAIPILLRHRYLLPYPEKGADGLVRLTNGEFHTYQVKFRKGRLPLTWSELATFLAISSEADGRFVLMNSEKLPSEALARDVYSISGSEFDRLTPDDLARIAQCIAGQKTERERKQPMEHQRQAVRDILRAFQDSDRAQAVMACGTGKTLVGLWAIEQSPQNSQVLVLVPSLALLAQTLQEYLRETSWDSFPAICVCSDPTVTREADEIVVDRTELPFKVSTDASAVREFLSRDLERHVVFSTYQSSKVVADGMDERPFDLAIFDESHKTATRKSTAFAFALSDASIAIKKRLFMTATPRHYNVFKRTSDGDSVLAYSMDDESVFGRRAYNLPFAEAVEKELICPFKVIVSVVTTEMLRQELEIGETVIEGKSVKAQVVARQIALQKALERHALSKIITFHNRVSTAQQFTSDGADSIGSHVSGFRLLHVNGNQRASDREGTLQEFRAVDRAIISNAGCLTEGVDVPAVDLVAFMSPKRSRIDIVQAVGRAMRKPQNSNKEFGYVFIPLFVDIAVGETEEQALERTEFDELWMVLQALQEQDSRLDEVIQELRVQQGKGVTPDFDRLAQFVEVLAPDVALAEIRHGIEVRTLERLGQSWDLRYGQLLAYKEANSHCNVPRGWAENPGLARWINTQRYGYESLSADKIQKLNEIGFVWNSLESQWEKRFAELKAYKETHGHCDVPIEHAETAALGTWVMNQRARLKHGDLPEDRVQRLHELGFNREAPLSQRWEERFAELVAYKEDHGNCDVPQRDAQNRKLAMWVMNQRQFQKKGGLSEDRVQRLNEIGINWGRVIAQRQRHSASVEFWEERFEELKAYEERYGNCDVPMDWKENQKLAEWVKNHRQLQKKGRLSEDRVQRLNEIGFVWNSLKSQWEKRFAELKAYKETHGHCDVPKHWPDNPELGYWVMNQRQFQKKGRLSEDRIQRLDAFGFVWDR